MLSREGACTCTRLRRKGGFPGHRRHLQGQRRGSAHFWKWADNRPAARRKTVASCTCESSPCNLVHRLPRIASRLRLAIGDGHAAGCARKTNEKDKLQPLRKKHEYLLRVANWGFYPRIPGHQFRKKLRQTGEGIPSTPATCVRAPVAGSIRKTIMLLEF
jgi:hypothetical protein